MKNIDRLIGRAKTEARKRGITTIKEQEVLVDWGDACPLYSDCMNRRDNCNKRGLWFVMVYEDAVYQMPHNGRDDWKLEGKQLIKAHKKSERCFKERNKNDEHSTKQHIYDGGGMFFSPQ